MSPDAKKEKRGIGFRDLTGKKFGRLLVSGIDQSSQPKRIRYSCICDCGKPVVVQRNNLVSGNTMSCGCLQIERASQKNKKHGESYYGGHLTKEYKIWLGMKARCYNPNNDSYSRYGARGIVVCERWVNSFETFLTDMGRCPSGMSIDRRNTNGNYEPQNCRWATQQEQQNNRLNNRWFTLNRLTKTISQWSRHLNKNPKLVHTRISRGWSVERALTS